MLSKAKSDSRGNPQWLCKCDCGKEIIVRSDNLKSGKTKSCGCYHRDKIREMSKEEFFNSVMKLEKYFYTQAVSEEYRFPENIAYGGGV